MWCPGWDPGTEKGYTEKLEKKKKRIKYQPQFIIVYQHWFSNYDKYIIVT